MKCKLCEKKIRKDDVIIPSEDGTCQHYHCDKIEADRNNFKNKKPVTYQVKHVKTPSIGLPAVQRID